MGAEHHQGEIRWRWGQRVIYAAEISTTGVSSGAAARGTKKEVLKRLNKNAYTQCIFVGGKASVVPWFCFFFNYTASYFKIFYHTL